MVGDSVPIPLTVIGGYLGSGKTTLVNQLLRAPGGRRLGVIVNDFGSLEIDAALLADAGGDDVVSLPNGCVCCTVGAGLHDALRSLTERPDPPDHVVIEVSGVADPSVAAGWATVPPFEPAGVIVLADATSVEQRSLDRYVGTEVRRQLVGADLVVLTKLDLCANETAARAKAWLADVASGVPVVQVVGGRVPADVILGLGPRAIIHPESGPSHDDRYETWSWTAATGVPRSALDAFVAGLPDGVLRLKGRVRLSDGSSIVLQVVGRRVEITAAREAPERSEMVAVAVAGTELPDVPEPFTSG